jgi:hypothetical protein
MLHLLFFSIQFMFGSAEYNLLDRFDLSIQLSMQNYFCSFHEFSEP